MRSLYFALAFLLLLGGVLFLILRDSNPFGKENSKFCVDWSDQIQKITISEGSQVLTLTKSEQGWLVNNNKKARESAISFIIKTLSSLEIKSPITETKFQDLFAGEDMEPKLVRVEGKGRKLMSFLIYKSNTLGEHAIFKRKAGSLPFYLSIPAYDTDPGSHFVCDELFWLPYNIFNLHPDKLKSVSLNYSDPDMDDILIEFDAKEPRIKFNGVEAVSVDSEKLKRYISYFTYIPFENWAFALHSDVKEKVLDSEPVMIFSIKMNDGSSKNVKLWLRLIEGASGVIPDTDRLYGEMDNGGELFIVRYFDIDPLIKRSEYFIKD